VEGNHPHTPLCPFIPLKLHATIQTDNNITFPLADINAASISLSTKPEIQETINSILKFSKNKSAIPKEEALPEVYHREKAAIM
jgi:hypothetical protein